MGIAGIVKGLAPLTLYAAVIVMLLFALAGRVRFTLLLVAFLMPLRNVIERLQAFPLGNQLMDLLIITMFVGWFISSIDKGKKLVEPSPVNGAAFIMIIYMFLSLEWGNQQLNTISFFDIGDPRVQDWKNFCLLPLLYFITLNNVRDKKWVWRIFAVTCFAMLLMGYYTANQIRWFAGSSIESRDKINGTFQFLGPNEVAAFFDQYTLILISVYLFMKKGLKKMGVLAVIVLNMFCIVFLYSRGAYIATAVGMLVIFLNRGRKWAVALLLVVMFWQVVLPEKAKERITGTKGEYGQLDVSSERRLIVWKQALEVFQGSPLIGIGYGVFRYMGFELGDTHNIYVKILAEQGIVGMFIFILVVLAFLREGMRLYQKGDDDLSRGLGLGFVACVLALVINNIFGDRWTYLEVSSYFWIYGGLVSRLNRLPTEETDAKAVVKKRKRYIKNQDQFER